MKHGYEIRHPKEPLSTFLQPPIQMAKPGHPQFKPEVEVGESSYHIQGSAREVVDFLKNLKEIEFVSPKDKLKNENSNEKVPSQPVRFKVSLISDESRSIEGQLGKVGVNLVSSSLDTIGNGVKKAQILLETVKNLTAEAKHEVTNEKISLDISAYHSPAHCNVVSFESDRVSAEQLGEALEAAIVNKLHHKTGRNFNAFQSAGNQYIDGVESYGDQSNNNKCQRQEQEEKKSEPNKRKFKAKASL